MGFLDTLLALRQRDIWARFWGLLSEPCPPMSSVEEAYRLGLQTGYQEGLVTGVDLGLDACRAPASDKPLHWYES